MPDILNDSTPPGAECRFSYTQYSPAPEVLYTTSTTEATAFLSRLQDKVLGFRTEWNYHGKWREGGGWFDGELGKTALIQVCDERVIVQFHLKEWQHTALPRILIDILQDKTIYKCGSRVRGDAKKLMLDFPSSFPYGINSLLEVSNVAREVDPLGFGPGNTLVELADLVRMYLEKDLQAEHIGDVDWSARMSQGDINDAAQHVYAGLQVLLQLRRLKPSADLVNCSNNILPTGEHYRGVKTESSILRTDDGGHNDGGFLPLTHTSFAVRRQLVLVPGRVKKLNATQKKAIHLFHCGLDIDAIASECGLKRGTSEKDLCHTVRITTDGTLTGGEIRRFLPQVRDLWCLKMYAGLFAELSRRIGGEVVVGQPALRCANAGAGAEPDGKRRRVVVTGLQTPPATPRAEEPEATLVDRGTAGDLGAGSAVDVKPDIEELRSIKDEPDLPRTPVQIRRSGGPLTPSPTPKRRPITAHAIFVRTPGEAHPATTTPPTRCRRDALENFCCGRTLDNIAYDEGVTQTTLAGYVCYAVLFHLSQGAKPLTEANALRLALEVQEADFEEGMFAELWKECFKMMKAKWGEQLFAVIGEQEGVEPEATYVEPENGGDVKVKLEAGGIGLGSPIRGIKRRRSP